MEKKPDKVTFPWLLLMVAPSIPFKHILFKLNVWLCNHAHKMQIIYLRRAMTIIKAKQDLEEINAPYNLYLAISETSNRELKLSGFFAKTPNEYQQELQAVPGEKFIVMSLGELRTRVVENFMMRRFQSYRAKVLAKNGGYYVH